MQNKFFTILSFENFNVKYMASFIKILLYSGKKSITDNTDNQNCQLIISHPESRSKSIIFVISALKILLR